MKDTPGQIRTGDLGFIKHLASDGPFGGVTTRARRALTKLSYGGDSIVGPTVSFVKLVIALVIVS